MDNILDQLKIERKAQKKSQQDVADAISLARGTYADIERGKIRLSLENFLLICEYLKINPILLVKQSKELLISVTPDEAKALNSLNTKVQNNFSIQNLNVKTSGDVIIGKNIKNK